MAIIIDKRSFGKNKSAVNRQRFIRRYKKQLKQAVNKAIKKRSITNIRQGDNITLPARDLSEPHFQHTLTSGKQNRVYTGNKEFITGDKLQRPLKGQSDHESQGSDIETGLDEFIFELSKEEFLMLFFDDLALPNLIKTQFQQTESKKLVRTGYTKTGVPTNINIVRSLKGAIGRKIALSGIHKKKIATLEDELVQLLQKKSTDDPDVIKLQSLIEKHKKRIQSLPFIDTFDIRYNHRTLQNEPSTQAVMFCIMDVSGSMDETKKEIAKRFFILLYLFLEQNYETIQLVFIRHHTSAKEVTEEDFFYSRETGGTVVSSALELTNQIIDSRYILDDWNIYIAQASDGDNWNADSPYCRDLILNSLISKVQYYAYVEIMPRHHQSLWEVYKTIEDTHTNFAMKSIHQQRDIYPVLHELFKRQTT